MAWGNWKGVNAVGSSAKDKSSLPNEIWQVEIHGPAAATKLDLSSQSDSGWGHTRGFTMVKIALPR